MFKEYQYQFRLEIATINLDRDLKEPKQIQICWANKQHSIMTKNKYRIDSSGKWYDIGQKLGMKGICKLSGRHFATKIFDLKVLVCREDKYEVYGQFPIDICSILIPHQPTKDVTRTNQEYLKNFSGKINYSLSAKFIKQCMPASLDNTTTELFTNTRPLSRQSQNSAQFSFQLNGTSARQFKQSLQQKQTRPSNNNPDVFLQQLQMKRNYDKKKQQVSELERQLSISHEKIRALENDKQQKNVNLMNDINILNNQNSYLKKQIQQLNNRFGQVRQDQIKIQQKTRRIQQLQAQNLRKYNQYIANQNRSNAKIRQISSFSQRMHQQNLITTAQIKRTNQRIKQLQTIREQQMNNYSKQKYSTDLKIKMLEQKYRQKQLGIQKIKMQYQNSSLEKNNVLMKQKQYKLKIDQQQIQIKKIQTENLAMKGMVKQLQQQYNQFKASQSKEKQQWMTRMSELQSSLISRQNDLKQRNQLIDQAKLYIQKKDEQIQQRNNFISKAKQYVQDKQANLKEVIQESQRYKTQLREKDKLILKLKDETVSLNERLRVSLQQGYNLRQQIQTKQKHLSQYLSDLAAQTQKTTELENQIQELRQELDYQKDQSLAKEQQMKASMSDLIKQNVEYKLQLAKTQTQLKRFQEKTDYK